MAFSDACQPDDEGVISRRRLPKAPSRLCLAAAIAAKFGPDVLLTIAQSSAVCIQITMALCTVNVSVVSGSRVADPDHW